MIGVFGGSGFYEFLDAGRAVPITKPYGEPAAPLTVGPVSGVETAFLPRHGRDHEYPPPKVPYRANVWAMKELGVSCVIGPRAAGSLTRNCEPGHFVVCDQSADRTTQRATTFFDGPETRHLSFVERYTESSRRCTQFGRVIMRTGPSQIDAEGPQ